jgi:hypothetical protein
MTYTFYITDSSTVSTEVHPLNWLDCSLVWEKEDDEVFYRQKFEGSLTFGGKKLCADYDLFYAYETADPCQTLYLTIYKDGDIYWKGFFTTGQGEWDFDAKTFTVTPQVIDDYTVWETEGDKEHAILALSRVDTVYSDGALTATYDRTILLMDVIEYLAQQVFGAGVTVVSEFLSNATNPITQIANRYNYLTIAQKSDILYPTSSNPATKGLMSFNGMMEILKCMNLRWEYAQGLDILTIEHISSWDMVSAIDIRTQDLTQSTNKFRYIKEELPKYEYFKWMEAYYDDFIGEPIWYDSACVSNESTDFALNVTTDIEYIRKAIKDDEMQKISPDGWVLFSTYLSGTSYYVNINSGQLEAEARFNADLSWSRLHRLFWKHDRQLPTGYMNGTLTTFYSSKKIKEQQANIIYCSTLNPNRGIITELGETHFGGQRGEIKKAVVKPYGEVNITLVYGPEASEITPETETKIIRIEESGICGELHATLSPAADVDIDLYIGYGMYDEDGNFVCGENPADTPVWTISAGATTANFTVSFDAPACGGGIPSGGCWNPVTDFTDAEGKGWTVYTIIQQSTCSC